MSHQRTLKSIALALACAANASAFAQVPATRVVRGAISDSATTAPVAGAVIMLLDRGGATTSRTMSDGAGRYRLVATTPSTTLRVIRIGFTPVSRTLTAADSAIVDVQLTRLPTLLSAVHVIDQPGCPADGDRAAAFALWEQARAALLATVVAQEANPATIRMISYTRTLGGPRGQVEQMVRDSTFLSTHGVVSRRAAAEYATLGYRERDVEHDVEHYYAPDAEVLLDSAFAGSHCFAFHDNDAKHPEDVGLTFTPISRAKSQRDSIVDVTGTIWVRRVSPALRSIDFTFTNLGLPRGASDTTAGGSMIYQEMPNGSTLVTRWSVYAPVHATRTMRVVGRTFTAATQVFAIREAGGEISDAQWSDSATWTATDLSHITGRVTTTDSRPLGGVLVALRGTNFRTGTDSKGAFRFPALVPGHYAVEALDPQFAAFGLTPSATVPVVVERGASETIAVTLPSRRMLVDSLCAEDGDAPPGVRGTGLVLGEVQAVNIKDVAGAVVRAMWTSRGAPLRLEGRADSTGHFQICGVPVGMSVHLSATTDQLAALDVDLTGQEIVSASLSLLSPTDAALPAYRHRVLQLQDSVSGAPLSAVDVIDATAQRTLGQTNEGGRLSLASVPEGTAMLRARKPGFAPRFVVFQVSPTDTAPVVVKLNRVTLLAGVEVTAAAISTRAAAAAGFEDRLKTHQGRLFTLQDLQRRDGESLATALADLGVRQRSRGSAIVLLGGRGVSACPITMFVDGFLLYSSLWTGVEPPDARTLNASDYGAIEYYADSDFAPAQFNATGAG